VSHYSAVPHAPGPAGGAVVAGVAAGVSVFVSFLVSVVAGVSLAAAFAFASASAFTYAEVCGTLASTGIAGSATGAFSTNSAGTVIHAHAALPAARLE